MGLVGGLDPTGGAGLLRDAWTAESLGLRVCAVATALTQQGRGGGARAWAVGDARLRAELARLAAVEGLAAVKIGVVPGAGVGAVRRFVEGLAAASLGGPERGPRAVRVVLDPVLAASEGGQLGAAPEALSALARGVDVLTPNRDEAAALAGRGLSWDELAGGGVAVLFKGERPPGLGPGQVSDRLVVGETQRWFTRDRVEGPDPRGTGCALATALACALAQGETVEVAAARAIAWLDSARRRLRPGPDGRPHLRRRGPAGSRSDG